MPVQGQCPSCKASLEFPDKSPEHPLRCPSCKIRFNIFGTDAKQARFVDYYRILGVEPNASRDEINKTIRVKVLEFHPDRHPDDPAAAEKLREVLEARDALSDIKKRADYDLLYHAPYLKRWDERKIAGEVIRSGPDTEHIPGWRGSVDRRVDGIDHLRNEIEEIEAETVTELKSVKHWYTIAGVILAAIAGFFVGGMPGAILFALVGAIIGYYLGSRF